MEYFRPSPSAAGRAIEWIETRSGYWAGVVQGGNRISFFIKDMAPARKITVLQQPSLAAGIARYADGGPGGFRREGTTVTGAATD